MLALACEWDGGAWAQLCNDIHGERGGDCSGFLASLSSGGSTLATGAPWSDGISGALLLGALTLINGVEVLGANSAMTLMEKRKVIALAGWCLSPAMAARK